MNGWFRTHIYKYNQLSPIIHTLNCFPSRVLLRSQTQISFWPPHEKTQRLRPNGLTPRFHYRQRDGTTPTLTFPLVTVSGDCRVSRGLKITKSTAVSQRFPNTTIKNPLDEENIEVTVESEYAGGWVTYFEERTEAGSVTTMAMTPSLRHSSHRSRNESSMRPSSRRR